MTRLSISGLTKMQGASAVLRDASLEVMSGKFCVVVGPSGCGKSTLLRLIAGLERADGGSIRFEDVDVGNLAPKDRNVGLVFQDFALYPHMNVRANLSYGLKISGHVKREIDERVGVIAEMLHLQDLLNRRPDQLSGGQRQRVAIGRAIIRRPKVLLLDEPFSSLDSKLRAKMRLEIRKVHAETGATTIFVTHDQTEAMALADHLIVMRDGRIVQSGPPENLYTRPANSFVATFLGDPGINLLPAKAEADGLLYAAGGSCLGLQMQGLCAAEFLIGIRPEHVRIVENGIPIRIDMIERMGSYSLTHGRLGAVTISLASQETLSPGQTIAISLPPEKLLFFDPESGASLPDMKARSP